MDYLRVFDVVAEPPHTVHIGERPAWVYALIILGVVLLLVAVGLIIHFVNRRR